MIRDRSLGRLPHDRVHCALIVAVGLALLPAGCASPHKNHNKFSALLVASGPFQDYDRTVSEKVQRRWDSLIQKFGLYERFGLVEVHFDLQPDGTIQNMRIAKNSAGDLLGLYCLKAIEESAPFDPLPESLRPLIGSEPRNASSNNRRLWPR